MDLVSVASSAAGASGVAALAGISGEGVKTDGADGAAAGFARPDPFCCATPADDSNRPKTTAHHISFMSRLSRAQRATTRWPGGNTLPASLFCTSFANSALVLGFSGQLQTDQSAGFIGDIWIRIR